MTGPIEGTLVLDGLLEGPLPDTPDARERLSDWTATAGRAGLNFSLQIEAGAFSLLASNKPLLSAALGPKPSETVASCLQDLVRLFSAQEGRRLASTLRSLEYQPGKELQSLYIVGPDGQVEVRQREVETLTYPPPEPLTRKEKLRIGLVGGVAVLLLVALSTFFVDYRQLYREARDRIKPFPIDQLVVDADRLSPYINVQGQRVEKGQLLVTLALAMDPPSKDISLGQAATMPVSSFMAMQALQRGYITCEYFDRDGRYMQSGVARIADLRTTQAITLSLPMPADNRLGKIVLIP